MSPEEYKTKLKELGIDRGLLSRGFDPDMANVASRVQQFEAACWNYKRRTITEEPVARDFGLSNGLGEAIARLVQREFEEEVKQKSLPKSS